MDTISSLAPMLWVRLPICIARSATILTSRFSGHFYLTRLLLPLLLKTASSTPSGKVRVVNTSSMGHTFVNHIDYDTLKDGPKRIKYGTNKLYFQSKFVRT